MTDGPDEPLTATVTVANEEGAARAPSMPPPAQRLELGDKIAEGGMGIVWRGHQRHLGREVAVKTLRPDRSSASHVAQLLQEAWVTGQLEHPNIVPIHDIVQDEDDRPQVVLKRVEGKSWRELIRDPEEVRRSQHARDPLEWHVRVLIAVCNALELAHSRGVVHRDVKPSNVMVGRFGEVYLLDWGLACGLQEDPSGRIPTAADSSVLAGTAAYMSPEQLTGDPARVSTRTDVYLLGATLYEVVTGAPPFSGRRLADAAGKAPDAPPDLPEEVPQELAAIVRRALATAPEDRFPSVRRLRLALEAFLEHRGSRALADRAEQSERALAEALGAGDHEEAERAFVEAAYGYRAALDAWEDNDEARQRLRAMTVARIRDALERGAPEAAARLLAALDDPPVALRREVEAKERALEEERARAAALERQHDRAVGVGTRRVIVGVAGTAWVSTWAMLGWVQPPPAVLAITTSAYMLLTMVIAALARRELMVSRPNLAIFWHVQGLLASMVTLFALGGGLGLDVPAMLTLSLLSCALVTAIAAATIDRRFSPAPAIYFFGFLLAALWPETLRWVVGGVNAGFIATSFVVNLLVGRQGRQP